MYAVLALYKSLYRHRAEPNLGLSSLSTRGLAGSPEAARRPLARDRFPSSSGRFTKLAGIRFMKMLSGTADAMTGHSPGDVGHRAG